jgi:hypothetical protein
MQKMEISKELESTSLVVKRADLAKYFNDPSRPLKVLGGVVEPGPFTAIVSEDEGISIDKWQWIAAVGHSPLAAFDVITGDSDHILIYIEPDSLFVLEHDQRMINGVPCALQTGSETGDYWADTTTGEFVAFVVPEGFRVDSLESFNWVMRKMLTVESQIMAVEQSADVIAAKAIVANATAMRERLYKRYASLENFFGPDLGEFARQQMEGKKERTFYSPYGSVGLRKKAGGVKVADPDRAIEVIETLFPEGIEAVATKKSFLISKVPEKLKTYIQEILFGGDSKKAGDAAVMSAFAYEPPSETVTIKTGVVGK